MAHFSILVVGDDVHGKMAKYQQNDRENEDAKHGWYEIGGRYRGMLQLKEGREGFIGGPNPKPQEKQLAEYLDETGFEGILDGDPRDFWIPSAGFVDQARFGDIDWGYMHDLNNKEQYLGQLWEMVTLPVRERSLELILEYSASLGVEAFLSPDYFIQMYGTKENYVLVKSFFWTTAVITGNGEWHELSSEVSVHASLEARARMEDWVFNFWRRFLKDLAPDTLITIADCCR